MTKTKASFLNLAKQACKRYWIETPFYVEFLYSSISRQCVCSQLLNKIQSPTYIMVSKETNDTCMARFKILFETVQPVKPSAIKNIMKECFDVLGINFEVDTFTVFSCNNKLTAIRKFSSLDFDLVSIGFENTDLFSEKYKLEEWARSKLGDGKCDKNDPFIKKCSFGIKKCSEYLDKKVENLGNLNLLEFDIWSNLTSSFSINEEENFTNVNIRFLENELDINFE